MSWLEIINEKMNYFLPGIYYFFYNNNNSFK